ncbi:MAG: hypothetical protein ABEI98_08575 [Halorhabdus sp.]
MSEENEQPLGGEEDIDLEVESVDDLKQRRRLEQVLEAEKKVNEARMKCSVANSRQDGLRLYRTALENYLVVLGPVIRDKKPTIWYEEPTFTLTISPPSPAEFLEEERQEPNPVELNDKGEPRFGELKQIDPLAGKEITLEGLGDIVTAPKTLTATWRAEFIPSGYGQKKISKTREMPLPMETLDKTLVLAQDFAAEQGLALNSSDGARPHNSY